MNTLTLRFIFSVMLLMTSSAFAVNRALEIDIAGIGPAVDAAAFETVKQVVGHAVANGVVDKFIVRGYGFEGGFSACTQASPTTKNFASFVRQLRSIAPNRRTTAYSLRKVAACTEDLVVCTQEVQHCPNGSYVGRIGPSCEFAPCPQN